LVKISEEEQWMQVMFYALVGSVRAGKSQQLLQLYPGKAWEQRFSTFNEMKCQRIHELGKELGLQCRSELVDE
jgi:hypothetical protein